MSNAVDKISIVTVREIIEEQKRLDIRLVLEVLKSAEKQKEIKSDQIKILVKQASCLFEQLQKKSLFFRLFP